MRIFLSSTYSDLKSYRIAVEELLREMGEVYVGMEYFGARSSAPLETCLQAVDESDVVIVIVGSRYGARSVGGKSFTHLEVERAQANGLPVFVFVQQHPPMASEGERRMRDRFLRWLGKSYTHAAFTDDTSLVIRVAAALRQHDELTRAVPAPDAWEEIVDRARGAGDYDCVAVSAQNVDRLYSVDRVAVDYETRIEAPIVAAGGSGANTAAGLGRLGLRVAVAGLVGADPNGDHLRMAMAQDNVIPLLAQSHFDRSGPTGQTVTYTDDQGRRSIYVDPGINESYAAAARDGSYWDKLKAAAATARIVHLSSFTRAPERSLQERLAGALPEATVLSLTPGALYCKLGLDRLAPLLQRVNVLFLYEQQLDVLIDGDVGQRTVARRPLATKLEQLYDWKAARGYDEPLAVIIKNAQGGAVTSPHGLYAAAGRDRLELSEPTQAKIGPRVATRDSTGAGDASASGMLWAILRGKPLNYAIDLAYVCSRSVSREIGARAGLPTTPQLRRRWRDWVGSPHRL